MLSTVKLALVYGTLGTLAAVIGIPYTLASGDVSAMYRAAMWVIAAGLRAAEIEVRVSGRENVPLGRSCIFMCNHVSNLDPPAVLPVLPGRAVVLLKRELMRIPLLGTAMRLGGYIPVDRARSRDAAQRSVAAAAKALDSGLHILVFPEGTRARDGRLGVFKKGPFFLAQSTGAPVVPVAIVGTQRLLARDSVWLRPGAVEVRLLPVIDPAAFTSREELVRAVRTSLAEVLPDEMRPADWAEQQRASWS